MTQIDTNKIAERAHQWELRQLGEAAGSPWGLWRKGYGELAFVRFGPTFESDVAARQWWEAFCKYESQQIAKRLSDASGRGLEAAMRRGDLPHRGVPNA